MKHTGFVVTGLLIAAISLAYALWGVDYASLASVFRAADYRVLLPFLGCLVLFYLFNATRWVLILRPLGHYTVLQSVPAMMIGFAGNNLFPARLGELVRAVVFARRYRVPASSVLVTVGLERLLDVLAILLFYVLAVLFSGPFPAQISAAVEWVALATAGVSAVMLVFLHWPTPFLTLWDWLAGRLPATLRARGHGLLRNAVAGLASLKSWRALTALVVHSLLRWAANTGMIWLSLRGFGSQAAVPEVVTVLAVAALAVTVPSAPGYLGALQAAFVIALLPFGIPREVALAASVFFLVAQWVPVTAVGIGCFLATGLRLREVRDAAEHVAP